MREQFIRIRTKLVQNQFRIKKLNNNENINHQHTKMVEN